MQITKIIQTIAVLNIVLADNMKNICIQYLENFEILTYLKEQSFLNKENTYYIGLKQEQVKLYCKDLKLWKYSNNQFNDPIELYPLDNNSLLFEINETKIVQYYAFIFESQNIKFMVKSMQIELIKEENQQRLMEETIPIESKLNFCSNLTCSIILNNPEIYIHDLIYIQLIVTDSNYSDYYLTNTTVAYTQEQVWKYVTIEAIDNSEKGKIIMLIQATLAWLNIEIQVSSSFSKTIIGTSLPRTTFSTITTTFKPLSQYNTLTCQGSYLWVFNIQTLKQLLEAKSAGVKTSTQLFPSNQMQEGMGFVQQKMILLSIIIPLNSENHQFQQFQETLLQSQIP